MRGPRVHGWLLSEMGESRVDKAAYPTPAEAAGLSSATPAPGVPGLG